MAEELDVPETKVLAIASHVAYGYVGNTMASFIMQSLGCEVTAINTVQYSNHSGYRQVKGRKTTAEEILQLYEGLKQSYLTDFDVLLSGYTPSAEAVEAVGKIGRELRFKSTTKPGSFFWVLDPVMGDDGRLYIPEDEVPAYKSLLREADLILPNQFEAELLSGTKITDVQSLATAIRVLHTIYRIPHIIITSIRLHPLTGRTLPSTTDTPELGPGEQETMTCIGSSATSSFHPRLFRIDIPAIPVFFSGTGDMFAALTVARLRAEAASAHVDNNSGWTSPDDVASTDLPLAKAVEKVLASMQAVLVKTYEAMQEELKGLENAVQGLGKGEEDREAVEKRRRLLRTKAAEVRVVRNVGLLKKAPEEWSEKFRAKEVELENGTPTENGRKPDELGVTKLGGDGEGAIHIETA
ncbi:pyridoxine kinase [Rhizodiscina lignyota]|uniref:pyridoxal kinase n=1 Tax=Rhizodiscina lignyota TaxID=1504668 RepID=A0A9P4IE75_9PEZI|nr:pyridoxine kinase [Rhizodiscina lignyota]